MGFDSQPSGPGRNYDANLKLMKKAIEDFKLLHLDQTKTKEFNEYEANVSFFETTGSEMLALQAKKEKSDEDYKTLKVLEEHYDYLTGEVGRLFLLLTQKKKI